ncbi:MAG: hypothetical protein IVW52_04870 [Acidimicrobiales bacterium]|nr:hypothetical protein [Acidimicrobiales bacterium]
MTDWRAEFRAWVEGAGLSPAEIGAADDLVREFGPPEGPVAGHGADVAAVAARLGRLRVEDRHEYKRAVRNLYLEAGEYRRDHPEEPLAGIPAVEVLRAVGAPVTDELLGLMVP